MADAQALPPNQAGEGERLGLRLALGRRWTGPRIFSVIMTAVVATATLLAVIPLFSVIYMVLAKGLDQFRLSLLWELPPGAGMEGGGFGNALVGTVLVVVLAAVLSVPIGIATAVYLTEFPGNPRSVALVRFVAKILSGLPSILAGVFVFAVIVQTTQRFSILAGAIALAVLMLPIITLATEESLRRVSPSLREASIGVGATRSQTVLRVVIPAARPAIFTGISLAVARAAGETAPLVFTALFSDYWIKSLFEPAASLSVLIYNYSSVPYENQIRLAWSASLVLILVVLLTNIAAQFISRTRK